MVTVSMLLQPVCVQVVLTLGLMIWLGMRRFSLLRSGVVDARTVALGEPNWPRSVLQLGNAVRNQFELPVLFYLVVVLALLGDVAGTFLLILAWAFVISRLLHALIHVTTNNVPRRMAVFVFGAACLSVMWLIMIAKVLFG